MNVNVVEFAYALPLSPPISLPTVDGQAWLAHPPTALLLPVSSWTGVSVVLSVSMMQIVMVIADSCRIDALWLLQSLALSPHPLRDFVKPLRKTVDQFVSPRLDGPRSALPIHHVASALT